MKTNIHSKIEDGSMSVTRSSGGQIWVCQWDLCSGKRGQNGLYREISKSDLFKMESDGIDTNNDYYVIQWAIDQPNSKPVWGKYSKK